MGRFDKNNIIFGHAEIFKKIEKKIANEMKYLLKYLVIFYLSKMEFQNEIFKKNKNKIKQIVTY